MVSFDSILQLRHKSSPRQYVNKLAVFQKDFMSWLWPTDEPEFGRQQMKAVNQVRKEL